MEPYPPDYPPAYPPAYPAAGDNGSPGKLADPVDKLPVPSLSSTERILTFLWGFRSIAHVPTLWRQEKAIYREFAGEAVTLQERFKTLAEINPSSDALKDPFGQSGRPDLRTIVSEGERAELEALDSLQAYREKVRNALCQFKWNEGMRQRFKILHALGAHELSDALKDCEFNFNWMSSQPRYGDLTRKCTVLNERRSMPL